MRVLYSIGEHISVFNEAVEMETGILTEVDPTAKSLPNYGTMVEVLQPLIWQGLGLAR